MRWRSSGLLNFRPNDPARAVAPEAGVRADGAGDNQTSAAALGGIALPQVEPDGQIVGESAEEEGERHRGE